MPRSPKYYRGTLANPIEVPSKPGIAASVLFPESRDRWKMEHDDMVIVESISKLHDLADHFGITLGNSTGWIILVLALARRHVPGFKVVEVEHGKPKRHHDHKLRFSLYFHVRQQMITQGYGPLEACRELVRTNSRYTGRRPESLYKTYQRARTDPLADIFERIASHPSIGERAFELFDAAVAAAPQDRI